MSLRYFADLGRCENSILKPIVEYPFIWYVMGMASVIRRVAMPSVGMLRADKFGYENRCVMILCNS